MSERAWVSKYLRDHPDALDQIFGGYTPSDFDRLGRHYGEQRSFDSPGDPPPVMIRIIPRVKTTNMLRQADILSKILSKLVSADEPPRLDIRGRLLNILKTC